MHIVVMGCGRVGSSLALQLVKRQQSVAVIDQDPLAFRRLGEDFAGKTIKGVGFDRETLISAGVEDADAFAAVSSGDNSNIIAARVARETFNVQRVVARIYDPKRAEVYERLGIPTVATVPWTASRLLRSVLGEWTTEAWRDPSGAIAMLHVSPDEGWVGHTIAAFESATGSRVGLVTRFGAGQLPKSEQMIQAGDSLHVLTVEDHVMVVREVAGHAPEGAMSSGEPMKVAIAGAGAVGRSIARELLGNKHDVLLIDKEPGKITPDRIPEAEWLMGDACEVANLEDADLESYDVVIGATGDDKVNLVVSLLAKTEFSVRRVVARINHPSNEWLFTEAWGVDHAVSTPRVIAALVEEAVEVGDIVRLFGLREGQANLVEVTLPDSAPVAGQVHARPRHAQGRRAGRDHPRQPGDHADAGGAGRVRRRAAVRRPTRGRGLDPARHHRLTVPASACARRVRR